MPRISFEDITENLTSDAGLNLRDTVVFHMFNPHGVAAAKRASDDRISAAVDAGILKGGAYFAYGSLNEYGEKLLQRQFDRKRPASAWKVQQAINWIKRDIEKADAAIAKASTASVAA